MFRSIIALGAYECSSVHNLVFHRRGAVDGKLDLRLLRLALRHALDLCLPLLKERKRGERKREGGMKEALSVSYHGIPLEARPLAYVQLAFLFPLLLTLESAVYVLWRWYRIQLPPHICGSLRSPPRDAKGEAASAHCACAVRTASPTRIRGSSAFARAAASSFREYITLREIAAAACMQL